MPRSDEKRLRRLRLEIKIEGRCKCTRLYLLLQDIHDERSLNTRSCHGYATRQCAQEERIITTHYFTVNSTYYYLFLQDLYDERSLNTRFCPVRGTRQYAHDERIMTTHYFTVNPTHYYLFLQDIYD